MNAHAILPPSAANRWTACPGSVCWYIPKYLAEIPIVQSKAAAEGTRLHTLLEEGLKTGSSEEPMVQSMIEYVNSFADEVWPEVRLAIGKALQIEREDFIFGTADVVAYNSQTKTLHIMDAKFGRIEVNPKSLQLVLYAIGALFLIEDTGREVRSIRCHIMQPFTSPQYKDVEYSPSDLRYTLGNKNKAAALRMNVLECMALYDKGEMAEDKHFFATDEGCKFCPGAEQCKAKQRKMANDFTVAVDSSLKKDGIEALTVSEDVSMDELSKAYRKAKDVIEKAEKVVTLFKTRLMKGEKSNEYQLKKLRAGTQSWTIKDAAVLSKVTNGKIQPEEFEVVKLRTPAEMKKVIGSEMMQILSSVIEQSEDVMTIVEIK